MKTVFELEGLHCGGCVNRVEKALQSAGLKAQVSLAPPQAVIDSEQAVSLDKVQEILQAVGEYSAKVPVNHH